MGWIGGAEKQTGIKKDNGAKITTDFVEPNIRYRYSLFCFEGPADPDPASNGSVGQPPYRFCPYALRLACGNASVNKFLYFSTL
jgi:hypothetical protein